jgi:L-malate glycosyltransferase
MTDKGTALARIRGRRIAHLIESDGPGGAERMVATLADAFQGAGCPSLVVLPARGEGWLAGQLEGTGVTIDHLALHGPISPGPAFALARLLRRHRVDVVHSHEFTMAVYGSAASRLAGLPHFITMHGGRYYASAWHRKLAMQFAVRVSAGLVGVSESVATQLRRDLGLRDGHVCVIPNGVRRSAPAAGTLREELGLRRTDRLIVAVGNLYPVKGHDVLLSALAELGANVPDVHLAIAGRGDLHDDLVTQARSLGIAARLHLLGYRADVTNVLASADVFALPSRSEGLPLAVLEAMFAGLPIVATDVGDVATVLGAGSGLVVPPNDSARLAGALRVLLSDHSVAERLGEAARRRAEEEFDLQRTTERYASLYAPRLGVD